MARVVVVNPPRRKNKKRRFTSAMRRAAMRNLRKARRKLSPPKRRRHVTRRAARRARRKRFVNPYQGTLAVLGNPSRSGHRKRRHTMAKKHRRHRRRTYSNPFSANALLSTPKEMVSTENLMAAAGVTAGFILPGMAMNYLPVTWRQTTITYYVSKVATVAVLSAVGRMVSPRVSKFVLLGGSVSILLDLYTEWMSGKSPAPTAPAGTTAPATNAFFGNLNAYYGGMLNDFDVP